MCVMYMSTSHSVGNNSVIVKSSSYPPPPESWLQQPGLHLQSGSVVSQSLLCRQVEAHPESGVKEKGPQWDSVSQCCDLILTSSPVCTGVPASAPGTWLEAGCWGEAGYCF